MILCSIPVFIAMKRVTVVVRCGQMKYHGQYPDYGFAEHKGYGTAKHVAAIFQHGPSAIHRTSFNPVKSMLLELEQQAGRDAKKDKHNCEDGDEPRKGSVKRREPWSKDEEGATARRSSEERIGREGRGKKRTRREAQPGRRPIPTAHVRTGPRRRKD